MNPVSDPLFYPTTGLASLDDVLRGVRRGDNIVWQIESLDEYQALVDRYAQASPRQRSTCWMCSAAVAAFIFGPSRYSIARQR